MTSEHMLYNKGFSPCCAFLWYCLCDLCNRATDIKSYLVNIAKSFMFLQSPGLNIITEYMIGYIYPGRPVANVCFKTYGYISMTQAVSFLSDFKLGHYMKIPPRAMFHAQV
jgi:hypothetical protein